jgi:hypothetical protein
VPSQWSTNTPEVFYSGIPGVDPAIDWALGPGRSYFFAPGEKEKDPWLPVTLHLGSISAGDLASGARFVRTRTESTAWENGIQIPSFCVVPPKGLEELKFCTAWVKMSFLGTLCGLVPQFIRRIELCLPLRATSYGKVASSPSRVRKHPKSRRSRLARRSRRKAKP